MEADAYNEAMKIIREFELFSMDGRIYMSSNEKGIELLFLCVLDLIFESKNLRKYLPQKEFILPAEKVRDEDPGWVNHFKDPDNKKFFLSDVYDFLKLITKDNIDLDSEILKNNLNE